MYYMGVDLGSVSTDIALIDKNHYLVEKIYLRTRKSIKAIQEGFKILKTNMMIQIFQRNYGQRENYCFGNHWSRCSEK